MTTENELKLKKVLAYQRARKIISTKQYKKELEYIKKIQDERTKRNNKATK